MKKVILLSFIITCIITSCGVDNAISITGQTDTRVAAAENKSTSEDDENTADSSTPAGASENDSISYEEYMQNKINDAVGGEHAGDDLYGRFIAYVDIVFNRINTFTTTEEFYACDKQYDPLYLDREAGAYVNTRPPLLYYYVQSLNLTREDIDKYNEALEIKSMPEEIIDALFLDDVNEAMQILKSPFAFYSDGKVYNIYEYYNLYKQNKNGAQALDIASDELKTTMKNILAYINEAHKTGLITYNDDLIDFVSSFVG